MNNNEPAINDSAQNETGQNDSGFVDFDPNDNQYTGACAIVKEELEDIELRRKTRPDKLKGLALSGGGIRSSSFCLGVIQVLARENKLGQFDYLSTVSGGGYLGGSLSWLWLDNWRKKTSCTDTTFGTGPDDFPFGTGDRHSNPDPVMDRKQASLIRHLRQHGKYLVPGHGITVLSFLSVVLRSITMGFVALIVLSSFLFHMLHYLHAFDPGILLPSYALDIGVFALFLYFLYLLSYGVVAIINRKFEDAYTAYTARRKWEIRVKVVLSTALVLLSIALVDELRVIIDATLNTTTPLWTAGGASTVTGLLLAWFGKKAENKNLFKIIPKTLMLNFGIIIMFFGLFVLSDLIAFALKNTVISMGSINITYPLHALLLLIIAYLSYKVPINKISIHRYYRDRLMETFMPDACDVFSDETYEAKKANETTLYSCRPNKDCKKPYNRMPYHIINCNLILVESEIAKFRGRGGDNFILSPLYCGSNATGWRESKQFAKDSITLPTAVAISGAAANPNSGVAGKGPTMNPLVSALMNIFNLRLGYWTVNPRPEYQQKQDANPNYFWPGFHGIINRKNLNEEADFIQLSDGGHFENLGMYELLRRRCRLIVCCDAEQDIGFAFEGLINIIDKARIDFGVHIKITSADLDRLKYSTDEDGAFTPAETGFLVADILYPDGISGQLIYLKTTLTEDLPLDLTHYKDDNRDFPDESTADQFFDEAQFEAYRRLGMHIAEQLTDDTEIHW